MRDSRKKVLFFNEMLTGGDGHARLALIIS